MANVIDTVPDWEIVEATPSAADDAEPSIVAMQRCYLKREALEACLVRSGIAYTEHQRIYTPSNP